MKVPHFANAVSSIWRVCAIPSGTALDVRPLVLRRFLLRDVISKVYIGALHLEIHRAG